MTHPAPSERGFGVSVGLVCAVLGCVSWWRGHARLGQVLAGCAFVLLLAAMVAPARLRGVNRVWWEFAQILGWINSRVLLTLFFVVVVTPVALVMRLGGRNVLRGSGSTNWTPYAGRRSNPKHFEYLF